MTDCLFCGIVSGAIPSKKVYEDDYTVAFWDISPQAPVHVLVVPKAHSANVTEAANEADLFEHCLKACAQVAKITGIAATGYRVISNTGADARQSVSHLHFHVLGGKQLSIEMA